jgi:hypothetical protein
LTYLFYNIVVYGFFMGFPVFHCLAGFVAGYYFGKRVLWFNIPAEQHPKIIRQVSGFTGFIMTIFCLASGSMVLAGDGAGSELQHMFGLGFEVTKPMIRALVLVGGISLILVNILLTRITMVQTIKKR